MKETCVMRWFKVALGIALFSGPACGQAPTSHGNDAGSDGHSRTGYISLESTIMTAGGVESETLAGASFRDSIGAAAALRTTTNIGDCNVITTMGGTLGGAPSLKSAGAIMITGGQMPLSLTPDPTNGTTGYSSVVLSGTALWTGGEIIHVDAAGGDVAAFSVSATAPSQVAITTPTPGGGVILADRSADLQFTWTGGKGGDVHVTAASSSFPGGGSSTMIDCRFPSIKGTGTLPKGALQMLPPAAMVPLAISGGGADPLNPTIAGDYSIDIDISTVAVWASNGRRAIDAYLDVP